MNKERNTAVIATLFMLATSILVSCDGNKRGDKETEDTPVIDVAIPIVKSVVLSRPYPASILSDSQADVVVRVDGQITGKFFEDGAYVRKGQKLFTIETTKYVASVDEAKATLANANSSLSYADNRLQALEEAFKSNAVSEMDVMQARDNKMQALASVNSARSALRIAQLNYDYCTVVAPVSGRITSSLYDVGAYVGGEGSPVTVASVYDENNLSVTFEIEDAQYSLLAANGIAIGDSLMNNVPLSLDGNDRPSVFARLYYVSPAVSSSTGTLRLKGRIADNSGALRQGMYVKAHLPYASVDNGILVRDASIGTDQSGKYLYVVGDSDLVQYRHIEVGELYEDTLRLVTKGIKHGERYVTEAMLKVRQGLRVKPVIQSPVKTK
ncbi:MAG: efflux RND transporter periplasmic adaptor subunit [Muribaculaceae bacterium]|nr:efflux RND transporter periplasmic adaptor subunit [Muribaculaceae bacterium]